MSTSRAPIHVNIQKVASKTIPDKEYVVRELIWDDRVEWRCSCPQSVLKNKMCKHILEVQAERKGQHE